MLRTTRSFRCPLVALLAAAVLSGGGCVRRVVEITSEPSGALVWLNDREVGTTPCEVEILHYGEYDLRVIRDGWEPVSTGRTADAPAWDLPGPDLFAELLPVDLESRTTWHVVLHPEDRDADAVMSRAIEMRDRVSAIEAADPDPSGRATSAGLAAEVEEADGGRPDPEAVGGPVEGPIGPVPPPDDPRS